MTAVLDREQLLAEFSTPAPRWRAPPLEEICAGRPTFGDRFCVTSSMGDAVVAHLSPVPAGHRRALRRHRLPLPRDDRDPDAVAAYQEVNVLDIHPG